MKRTTYLALAGFFILLAGGLYYFLKDEPLVPRQAVQQAQNNPGGNLSFVGTSLVEEKDGVRQWELNADRIEVDPNTQQLYLKNLKAVYYQEKGGKVDITAKQAMMDSKTRDITMEGEIKAIASDGAVFTAHSVRWLAKDKYIYGTGGIVFTRDDTTITGDRIEIDNNMEKIKVLGNARVQKGGASR